MIETARAHLTISGVVQGVFYRASAAEQAGLLGLSGWVRNLPDGRVEAVAEGPRSTVEAFVDWCRRGPVRAKVDEVIVVWAAATGEQRGFEVRR